MIFYLWNIFFSLWSCFVKLSSCLRDCNRQDDWHPMSNYDLWIIMNYFICKPKRSCPTWTHYFLFCLIIIIGETIWSHLCVITGIISLCSRTLPNYICKYFIWNPRWSHATFITCTNFILLNSLCLYIYTIMCLMYDILFCLLYFLSLLFLFPSCIIPLKLIFIYICILYYSSRPS